MVKDLKFIWILVYSLVSLAHAQENLAFSHRGGNGGSVQAYGVYTVIQNIERTFSEYCSYNELMFEEDMILNIVDKKKWCEWQGFIKSITKAGSPSSLKVMSLQHIEASDGHIRDAVNFYDTESHNRPVIIVNESSWEKMDAQEKVKLTLHELFGLMGKELSDDYHLTRQVMMAFTYDFIDYELFLKDLNACSLYLGIDNPRSARRLIDVKKQGYNDVSVDLHARFILEDNIRCHLSNCFYHLSIVDKKRSSRIVWRDVFALDTSRFFVRSKIKKLYKENLIHLPLCQKAKL